MQGAISEQRNEQWGDAIAVTEWLDHRDPASSIDKNHARTENLSNCHEEENSWTASSSQRPCEYPQKKTGWYR